MSADGHLDMLGTFETDITDSFPSYESSASRGLDEELLVSGEFLNEDEDGITCKDRPGYYEGDRVCHKYPRL